MTCCTRIKALESLVQTLTKVDQLWIELGASPNVNLGTVQVPLTAALDGVQDFGTLSADTVALPEGRYVFGFTPNLEQDSGVRSNFKVALRSGTTQLRVAYGPYYSRNASAHEETGGTVQIPFVLSSPDVLNFAFLREAGAGVVRLEGGWITVTKYQKL